MALPEIFASQVVKRAVTTEIQMLPPPRFFTLLLKSYAVFLFLSLVVSVISGNGGDSFFGFIKNSLDLKNSLDFSVRSSLFEIISALYFLCFTVYCVGLFRLRRWTVVVTMVIVTKNVLGFIYQLFIVNNEQGILSIVFLLPAVEVTYSLVVAVTSILFRKYLTGTGRKLWLQSVIILSTVPTVLLLALSIIFVDNKTVDDAQVLPIQQTVLPDAQNAYQALVLENEMTPSELIAFEKAMTYYQDVTSDERLVGSLELSAVIAATRRISDAFIVAATLPGTQCPEADDVGSDTITCSLNMLRDTAKLVHLRVIDSYQRQDYQDMTRASIALMQFAHRYEQVSPKHGAIEYLLASAIRGIGYDALTFVIVTLSELQQGGLLEQTLFNTLKGDIQAALEANRPSRVALSNSIRFEYGFMKKGIADSLVTGASNYLWQPNKTLQEYAAVILATMDYYNQPCGSTSEQEKLEILNELKKVQSEWGINSYLLKLLKPNAIGQILNSAAFPALNDFKDRYCTADKKHKALESLLLSI